MGLDCTNSDCGLLIIAVYLPFILGFISLLGVIGLIWTFLKHKRLALKILSILMILPGIYVFADFNFISKRRDLAEELKNVDKISMQTYSIDFSKIGYKLDDVTLTKSFDLPEFGDYSLDLFSYQSSDLLIIKEYQKPKIGIQSDKCIAEFYTCVRAGDSSLGPIYSIGNEEGYGWVADMGSTVLVNDESTILSRENFIKLVETAKSMDKTQLKAYISENKYWKH